MKKKNLLDKKKKNNLKLKFCCVLIFLVATYLLAVKNKVFYLFDNTFYLKKNDGITKNRHLPK